MAVSLPTLLSSYSSVFVLRLERTAELVEGTSEHFHRLYIQVIRRLRDASVHPRPHLAQTVHMHLYL
jgi:hypothetical protein